MIRRVISVGLLLGLVALNPAETVFRVYRAMPVQLSFDEWTDTWIAARQAANRLHAQLIPTHYVSATGSAASNCTIGAPCTFARAVTLVNNGTINDGSVIQLASGRYTQLSQTITGSGAAGNPITFLCASGQYFFGGRVQTAHTDWTLVGGRTYTYQMVFDEAVRGFTPLNVAQNRPTANWRDLTINDGGNKHVIFDITEAPKFRPETSIAEVEQQGGSFYFDAGANRLYIHTYTDTAPAAGANIWVNAVNGYIEVDGDFIHFDGCSWEQVAGTAFGFQVDDSANGFEMRNFEFQGTTIDIEGTNFVIEDGISENSGEQGEPGAPQCDESPQFVGQCFSDSGSFTAINVSGGGPGLIQDVQIKRGWNAFSPAGSTGLTLNRVIMWGFPNHALGMGGYNQTIRNSIVFNSQESFYSQGLPSPTTPLVNFVMENNFFPDKVLFRGASNSNMTIRYNIFTQVAADTDNMAGPFAAVDCNIYFKMPSADVWEVDGASPNYETLADLKAATTFEDHGAELTEADLSNGTQFVLFAKPYVETYDLHPAGELSQSVNMPAACGSYVGPSTSSTPSAPPAPAPPSAPLLKTLIRTRPAEIGMTATASRRVEPRQPHHSPF